jgi:hypothetical protein
MANFLSTQSIRSKTARQTNRFLLEFTGLNDIIKGIPSSTSSAPQSVKDRYNNLNVAATEGSVEDALKLSLLSVSVPSTELEVVDIARFHDTVKQTTRFTPQADMQAVFYDYIDGSASAAMYIWHGLVAERSTGSIGYKEDYILTNAFLYEYGPTAPGELSDGKPDPKVIARHRIINLYPKNIELGEHSYETAEVRKVTVTFALDAIYPDKYWNKSSRVLQSKAAT